MLDLGEPSFGVGLTLEALGSLTASRVTVSGSVAGLATPHAALDVPHPSGAPLDTGLGRRDRIWWVPRVGWPGGVTPRAPPERSVTVSRHSAPAILVIRGFL